MARLDRAWSRRCVCPWEGGEVFKVISNTNHSGFHDFLCAAPQWPAQGIGHPGQRWDLGTQVSQCSLDCTGACSASQVSSLLVSGRIKDAALVKLFVIHHT